MTRISYQGGKLQRWAREINPNLDVGVSDGGRQENGAGREGRAESVNTRERRRVDEPVNQT